MSIWLIELVTNDVTCNNVEVSADSVEKIDYHNIMIDGVRWQLPKMLGMSFAEVVKEEGKPMTQIQEPQKVHIGNWKGKPVYLDPNTNADAIEVIRHLAELLEELKGRIVNGECK